MGTILETMGPELENSEAWKTIYPYMHSMDYTMDFVMQVMDKQDGKYMCIYTNKNSSTLY